MTDQPTDEPSPGLGSLPVELAARVDAACDGFEAAWARGMRPLIEDYLGAEAEPVRSVLFRELLQSEWECRRRLGERPRPEEYQARFPDRAALIDELLGGDSGGSDKPPGPGSTVFHFPVEPAPLHGRYVIKKFHAGGGIGEVYRAEDREIGREVALKRLRDRTASQDRFLAEAQVTGQLEHPGIVPVHDVGTDAEGRPFYVMKFVRGRTLKDVIAAYHAGTAGDGAAREVVRHRLLETFVVLCQAVAYAHSRGVVHRDLKPDNVMVGEFGETIVVDWGLAKVVAHPYVQGGTELVHLPASSGSAPTLAGVYMGSPPYMPPELAEGHADDADERTDVYLLGATLYEIITGKAPRSGSSRDEMIELARSVDPAPPRQVKPEVPRALEAICQKAMYRRKQDRYAGAGMLARDVQRYLAGEPVSVYREGPVARSWRWCKRHRRGVERAAAAVLVLAVVAGAGRAIWRLENRRRAELRVAAQERERLEKQREAARREAAQARAREDARADVAEFRRLADEAHFFAASILPDEERTPHNTLPDDQRAPYYDVGRAESRALAALARIERWGADLSALPIADERGQLRDELHDLTLLIAQARIEQRPQDREAARAALALLDRAARVRTPTRWAHRLRSACALALGDRRTADQERLQADDPATPVVALDHFLAGESLRRQSAAANDLMATAPDRERLGQAIDAYRQALELRPNHYWSRLQRGRCYLSLGHLARAVEELSACVGLRPDSAWGYSARGLALALQKRYDEALHDLEQGVALGSRPAQLNRGMVYLLQRQHAQALSDFAAVLEPPVDRRLIEAAYYRAVALLDQGRLNAARVECDAVVAENPGFAPVYLTRTRLHLVGGNLAAGRDDLNRYLSLTRGPGFNLQGAGACRLRGRYLRLLVVKPLPGPRRAAIGKLAVAELQKAITLGDSSPGLYQDLGAVHDKLGRPDRAIEAYSLALKTAPDEVQTRVMRGWAHAGQDQLDLAAADFAEATRQDPGFAEAHAGLGYVRALLKAPGDAQREALQALLVMAQLQHPSDYIVFHNVACIYARLAQADAVDPRPYQDQAIALLRHAIGLWKDRGNGPNEIAYIMGEKAFDAALRARPEFQALISQKP
jgi:tetratricopeptide (TPR) repeat protein/tRNA A-37 threonylcarbamoyl transferase component Bud32